MEQGVHDTTTTAHFVRVSAFGAEQRSTLGRKASDLAGSAERRNAGFSAGALLTAALGTGPASPPASGIWAVALSPSLCSAAVTAP